MKPGTFQWCQQQDKGQRAQNRTQEVPYEHKKKLLYCEAYRVIEQTAQRGCGAHSEAIYIEQNIRKR